MFCKRTQISIAGLQENAKCWDVLSEAWRKSSRAAGENAKCRVFCQKHGGRAQVLHCSAEFLRRKSAGLRDSNVTICGETLEEDGRAA